jgi:hypothetical protein
MNLFHHSRTNENSIMEKGIKNEKNSNDSYVCCNDVCD